MAIHRGSPGISAVFWVCVLSIPFSAILTILRLVSTIRSGRRLGKDDYSAIAGLAVLLVYDVLALITLDIIDGRDMRMLPLNDILLVSKLSYATAPFFVPNQFFTKFSIIFLFQRLFWVDKRFMRWVWATAGLHVAYIIVVLPIYLFSCRPISRAWNPLMPGTCINNLATVAGCETINSFIDFVLIVLAIAKIQSVKLKRGTKWKLGIVFGTAGLAGVIGFVKIGETYKTGYDPLVIAAWAIAQMAVSVFCCCAPTFMPILPSEGYFDRIISSFRDSTRSLRRSARSSAHASAERTGRNNTDKGEQVVPTQGWHRLEGPESTRKLVWTEVGTDGPGQNSQASHGQEIPMKTFTVKQDIEKA